MSSKLIRGSTVPSTSAPEENWVHNSLCGPGRGARSCRLFVTGLTVQCLKELRRGQHLHPVMFQPATKVRIIEDVAISSHDGVGAARQGRADDLRVVRVADLDVRLDPRK